MGSASAQILASLEEGAISLRWARAETTSGPPYNQPALKVLIVGCGRVGSQIASDMDKAGHQVVIIDRDPNQFSRASSRGVLTTDFKGDQVVGNGTDADVLRRAGIEDADGFVAVTEGDNRNIMAAQVAKHVFKVPRVVARIYDPERAEAYEKLGLHTICPTIEGAKHIEKTLLETH
jgi:trk system potassium uptake protein TrkA